MAGKVLLDTSVVVAIFAGKEESVRSAYRAAEQAYVSSTVLGELYLGALGSARIQDNLREIEMFAAGVTLVSCDAETARIYAEVKRALRLRGRPIPDNDIWIAASAIQHRLTLATRDAHFNAVDGVTVARW